MVIEHPCNSKVLMCYRTRLPVHYRRVDILSLHVCNCVYARVRVPIRSVRVYVCVFAYLWASENFRWVIARIIMLRRQVIFKEDCSKKYLWYAASDVKYQPVNKSYFDPGDDPETLKKVDEILILNSQPKARGFIHFVLLTETPQIISPFYIITKLSESSHCIVKQNSITIFFFKSCLIWFQTTPNTQSGKS